MHLNHAETIPLTQVHGKKCLPWNWSLILRRLGTTEANIVIEAIVY